MGRRRVKGKSKSTKIFQDITDLPDYDSMLEDPAYFRRAKARSFKIKNMRPDDYFREAAKIHGVPLENEYHMVDRDRVGKYADRVKAGSKMPMPTLHYGKHGGQEGRHRVAVAKLLGKRTVPVMTIKSMDEKKYWNWLLSNDPKSIEAQFGIPKEYKEAFWKKRKKK